MRRFTRLTNAFSKKVENHAYAVALQMMYYNLWIIISSAFTLSCAYRRLWLLPFLIAFGK
jgi:predicted signal transduction protein with EAL and GGDEF domain